MWREPIDPFSMSDAELRLKLRYEMGLASSDPRAMAKLPDEDIDRLPGQLPRLFREVENASSGRDAQQAAENFLTASEEYVDR